MRLKNFYRGEEIKIFSSLKDSAHQIYKILEIDKTRRYVKLINLNYNQEFKLLLKLIDNKERAQL